MRTKTFPAVLKYDQTDAQTACGDFPAGTIGTIVPHASPDETNLYWFFNPQGTFKDFGFFLDSSDFLELVYVSDFAIKKGVIVNDL